MRRIFKTLIRISSFLGKEMTEIFRQPRLILTLVLGPFLIMFLFGLGYPDQNRTLRTTFVTTDPATFQKELNIFTESFNAKIFEYVIESDKEQALAKLALNQNDLVIVVPDVPFETIQNNQQAEFLIYHNEVDPIQIAYIQSVARILVDEVNRQDGRISIDVTDNVKVASVRVTILDDHGESQGQGQAVWIKDDRWEYETPARRNILVEAFDLPGNVTRHEA